MAIVSSPNVFTADQTVKGANVLTQDSSGNTLAGIQPTSTGNGTFAGQVMLYGANATQAQKQAWYFAVDTVATTPYRDLAIGRMNTNGTASDADGIYISFGGGLSTTPASIGIGQAQPADSGRLVRLKVQSGSNTQGGVQILQSTSVTIPPFSITDLGAIDRVYVDPSNTGTWNLILSGDASTTNPILTVQTTALGNAEQFRVNAQGQIRFVADANAVLSRMAAGIIGVNSNFQVLNTMVVGTGAAAGTAPTAQGDFVTASTNTCSVYVRNTTQGALRLEMAGSGNVAHVWTSNASALQLGVSATKKIEISGAGGIGVFGTTAITQFSTTGQTTGFTAGAGTAVDSAATFTGGTGSTAYTIGDVVRALKLYGWLAA